MILDIYRGSFSRIYIFSPSIDVDSTWVPVKKYIKDEMKVEDDEKDPIYFSEYDPEKLHHIIQTQSKVTDYMKKQKETKKLFSILIIVDDMADNPLLTRQSKLLHACFTRGRHNSISTIVATQKFSCIAPIIRVNEIIKI